MRPIHKTIIELVVLSTEPFDADMDLQDIADMINDGPWIGDWTIKGQEQVTDPDILHDELTAIGNDGTFFDPLFNLEEREKGDDDGMEYGDPRDYRDERE